MNECPSATPVADFLLVAGVLPPFVFLLWGFTFYLAKKVVWEDVMDSRWPWQKD